MPPPTPLSREGETVETMRARLVYQSRKRGTLENDLLLSTFAKEQVDTMNEAQLKEFDKLMDELDWDIYYWATGKKTPPERWANSKLLEKLRVHVKNGAKSFDECQIFHERDIPDARDLSTMLSHAIERRYRYIATEECIVLWRRHYKSSTMFVVPPEKQPFNPPIVRPVRWIWCKRIRQAIIETARAGVGEAERKHFEWRDGFCDEATPEF
ncbi:Succinate dehydrogenase assembly factor 2, mitochondrial [Grifola frondosa]|uniref:Succinate dehydrogenase assembly factor 2, mitochondrial n=1 Tax=Grifola frondosa TaxID=5627 RepID=A0A1C7LS02_GRIFR|nr:Succinate dehydrogenase assembly factor 2, mitochondrial [Grifola frondosa]